MKRTMPAFLMFALLALPGSVYAQSVRGRVLDRKTDRPIPSAQVSVLTRSGTRNGEVVADSAGRFLLELSRGGVYRLQADRIGYQAVTSERFDISEEEDLVVDVYLASGAVDLAPLLITSRPTRPLVGRLERAGFYERERNAPGFFMRREEVESVHPVNLSDLLVRVPGARRARVRGGGSAIALSRSRGSGRVCLPAVFLDGQPLNRPDAIDNIVHVTSIEALEVYRGPSQTPANFAGIETGCGVVVIWTKERV